MVLNRERASSLNNRQLETFEPGQCARFFFARVQRVQLEYPIKLHTRGPACIGVRVFINKGVNNAKNSS